MSLLTHPPAVAPATVEDVLAVAHAMEREATARYAALGRSMRRVGHDDVAQVFESLAAEEQHHVDQVELLSQQLLHRLPDPAIVRWELPDTFSLDDEAGSALLTPYRALSIAVRNEERAFAFWSYVAAEAANPQVRTQAEAMARQELLHAAKLRHERRRAYHAERAGHAPAAQAHAQLPATVAAASAEAHRLAGQAAAFLDAAAARLDGMGDPPSAKLLHTIAAQLRAALGPTVAPQQGNADESGIARSVRAFAAAGNAALLFETAGVVERLVLTCLEWLDARPDPALAEILQPLAAAATEHLIKINTRLVEVEPSLRSRTLAAQPAP